MHGGKFYSHLCPYVSVSLGENTLIKHITIIISKKKKNKKKDINPETQH